VKSLQTTVAAMVCCLLLAGIDSAHGQTYYKWTDDNGTVHFTAEPPPDRDYESIDTSGNVVSTTRLEPLGDEASAPAQPEPDSRAPREGQPDPALVEARCTEARENLFWLQSNRRIVIEDDQGNDRFIDADEQQDLIEENRALLEEWCDGEDAPPG